MRSCFFLFSEVPLLNLFTEIFTDVEIIPLTLEKINNTNFKNNNVLLVCKNNINKKINESFFLKNNVVIFYSKKNEIISKKILNSSILINGHRGVKKFSDEIKTVFLSKPFIFKDIHIYGEKLTNLNSNLSLLLTPLEKEILIFVCENKEIKKTTLLEKVLKIKKDIETKTIESHLTRIRKKLISIKCEIQIFLKDDVVYLKDQFK